MFAGLARQEAPGEQIQLIAALEDVFLVEPQAKEVAARVASAGGGGNCQSGRAGYTTGCRGCRTVTAVMPATRLKDDLDEQLLPIFLEEAQDQLRELTVQLRLWRGDLASDAQPHAIARLLHTFKGNARMAGAMNLGEFTHLLESRVEDVLRAGAATPAFIDEIESGCDTLDASDRALAQWRIRSHRTAACRAG